MIYVSRICLSMALISRNYRYVPIKCLTGIRKRQKYSFRVHKVSSTPLKCCYYENILSISGPEVITFTVTMDVMEKFRIKLDRQTHSSSSPRNGALFNAVSLIGQGCYCFTFQICTLRIYTVV